MKLRELYGGLMMFAIIIVPWLAFIWEFTTGAEVSTHRSVVQVSTTEHLGSTLKFAIFGAVLGIPFAFWCNRKRSGLT